MIQPISQLFVRTLFVVLPVTGCFFGNNVRPGSAKTALATRPNILLVISDDQSYPHASAYGDQALKTPAFDRIAREGVLFTNAFAASPGCSPSRAALLTGKNCWQLREAGTHASSFPADLVTYTQQLEQAGYFVGLTGKGWGPGKVPDNQHNPAGKSYDKRKLTSPPGISNNDYAANFGEFMDARPAGTPFCFWFGAQEPHRKYPTGMGLKSGLSMEKVRVPGFLPDHPDIRSDMLDYFFEIQWYDSHLGRILKLLEDRGELDNTLIVVSSDNGMPFPRAKANCYEYGIHMPLAIRWGNRVRGGRTIDDLVSLIDLAPTFLEAAGIKPRNARTMEGRSLMPILNSRQSGLVDKNRQAIYASRERHSSSRWNNLGYPQRCLRTADYLYIWNIYPDRWPAGDPQAFGDKGELEPMHSAYFDIDDFDESLLIRHREDSAISPFFHLAVDKRPEIELYAIRNDPYCLKNLAEEKAFMEVRRDLDRKLKAYLNATGDPRLSPEGEGLIESYKRYSPLRQFPKPVR